MPVFYHGGRPYRVGFAGLGAAPASPPQIQQLPLDLLRAHIYPRDPAAMQDAVNQAGDVPPTDYIPARMMETRWKTPPYQRAWGSNVVALMEAMRAYAGLQEQITSPTAHVPVQEPDQSTALLQADRLPQPSDNFDTNVDAVPLARNALPDDRIAVRGPDLVALSQAAVAQRTANAAVGPAKLQNALNQASMSVQAVNKIVSG